MDGCLREELFEESFELFSQMKKQGLSTDPVTGLLIRGCCKFGKLRRAFILYNRALRDRLPVEASTLRALAGACRKRNRDKDAVRFDRLAEELETKNGSNDK